MQYKIYARGLRWKFYSWENEFFVHIIFVIFVIIISSYSSSWSSSCWALCDELKEPFPYILFYIFQFAIHRCKSMWQKRWVLVNHHQHQRPTSLIMRSNCQDLKDVSPWVLNFIYNIYLPSSNRTQMYWIISICFFKGMRLKEQKRETEWLWMTFLPW